MIAEIGAGITSLKAALDITKGLSAVNTQVSINDVRISLQEHILNAQLALAAANEAQATAAQRVRELEQEIVRLKESSTEKGRYQLHDLGRGAVAYMLKPGMDNGEAAHWLCANCFNQGRKAFLQFKGQDKRPGGGNAETSNYGCDTCKSSLKVLYTVTPARLWERSAEQMID